MVFFQDFVDKLQVAKKKLFPNTWGCVGEMSLVHFRNIIISQWVLLSITLILSIVYAAIIVSFGEFGIVDLFILYPAVVAVFVAVIGMIASGFGTSIYSSADQEGPDMLMKKALFHFCTLVYIFIIFGAIVFTVFYLTVLGADPIAIILLVIFICLFILALVTLIMRTCCIWNKNDLQWIEKSVVEDNTDKGVSA
ncbi:unnamed protein product [Oikopleura dioica]|uniref:Uncharacterized protein n=1 Tax=Oikopleura dioica TaxID=34765 RepID=E4WYI8_OIKDI|nr:unnamed protein product [Oikopleura dioica]CBY38260.1 unnamed protein product [Oikopleura dioica]